VQPLWKLGWHILNAMNGQVCPTVQQGLLNLLDKKTLAANLCQGNIEDFIPRSLNDHQFYDKFLLPSQQLRFYPLCLPQS
jgi:hypothetical protein